MLPPQAQARANKAAVALRKVALKFAAYTNETPADSSDHKGRQLNHALLRAAIAYAEAQHPYLAESQLGLLRTMRELDTWEDRDKGLSKAEVDASVSSWELEQLFEKGYVRLKGRGWRQKICITEAGKRFLVKGPE